MTEPKLRLLQPSIFYRLGVSCPACRRVFRNEQGLAGHRYHRHGGRRHD